MFRTFFENIKDFSLSLKDLICYLQYRQEDMAEHEINLKNTEDSRLRLEENIAKLRASLRHWQQWEIEYEGMREGLAALGEDNRHEGMLAVGNDDDDSQVALGDSQGDLLNAEERGQLLYDNKGNTRSAPDVIGLLLRRIDYVQQNVKTATSLLNAAEDKLTNSTMVVQPDIRSEESLPITEILEELDKEGNVIHSSISYSDQKTSQIVETIRKAGVNGLPKGETPLPPDDTSNELLPSKPNNSSSDSSEVVSESARYSKPRFKKRVSFAEGTKSEPEICTPDHLKTMPRLKKEAVLRDICNRIAEEERGDPEISRYRKALPGHISKAEEALDTVSKTGRRVDIAERCLKTKDYREARRLLKHCQDGKRASLRGAARLLSEMIERKGYHVDHYDWNDKSLWWRGPCGNSKNAAFHRRFWGEAGDKGSSKLCRDENSNIKEQGRLTEDEYHERLSGHLEAQAEIPIKSNTSCTQRINGHNKPEDVGGATAGLRTGCSFEAQEIIHTEESWVTQDPEHRTSVPQDTIFEDGRPNLQSDDETLTTLPGQSFAIENDGNSMSTPVTPVDESPEDAALRRQMLQYNMNEVGAVVAELDLDDEDGDDDAPIEDAYFDEDDNEIDLQDSQDSDEEEDEHGRTWSRVLTQDYFAEMQALEKKLKDGNMINVGPNPEAVAATNGNTIKEPPKDGGLPSGGIVKPKAVGSRGVRFADKLDVQEAPPIKGLGESSSSISTPNLTQKAIFQREAPATAYSMAGLPTKKPSRFKTARKEQTLDSTMSTPHEVDGSSTSPAARKTPINAGKIVERAYDPTVKASEPDDLDPAFLNQEVNAEYHRLRNRMIYRDGGYSKREDERAEVPIDDHEEIGGKKMSRFRAARLGIR